MKTLPICVKCNTHLKIGYNLSALDYCPVCTSEWVKDFMKSQRTKRKVRA
jgi:formate dehydrogenase maturation protein FdhE